MRKRTIIKRIGIVLFLSILCCGPLSLRASAQAVNTMNVTIKLKQASLKTFFDEVSKQTGLDFIYDSDQMKNLGNITIDASEQPVRSVLSEVMNQVGCTYAINGNIVTVTRKNAPVYKKGVSGLVTDGWGVPLAGVTIRMQGHNGGYVTDVNGRFEIPTDRREVHLTFSYIGFKPLTQMVKSGVAANIVMAEDAGQVDEVVVTGYGTRNKNSFTGSEVSVKREQLMSMGTKNVLKSLAAFVPGMVLLENNAAGSDPNQMADINIRGRSTFEGTANMPVFVVDGSQVSVEYVYDMDINDIESVTVLKDASASALYGAKASAGVIVITTKALQGGKLKLNYSGTYRLSTPDLSDYHLLNAAEKLEYERLAGNFTNAVPSSQYQMDLDYAKLFAAVQSGVNTDWLSKPLRNAFSHSHSLSIDGGDERARYNVGVRYGKDAGVMKGSDRERLSANFKLSYNVPGKFFVSNTGTISSVSTDASPYGDFSDWVKQNPYENPYDENGDLRAKLYHDISNPLYEASLGSYGETNNLDFRNTTSLQIWIGEKFRIDGDFSFEKSKQDSRTFTSPFSASEITRTEETSYRGKLVDSWTNATSYQGKLMVSYNNYLLKKMFLTVMGGSSIESSSSDGATYRSVGFYTDKLGTPAFAAHYEDGSPSGSDSKSTGVGFFANANAIWDNRYFLDLIYRYEGSSKFGKNSRFAPFWSVGTGWNIHNEKFMKGLPVQLLKLRASLGYLGNISFQPYQALTTYTYRNGYNYAKGIGAVPMTIGNKDLKWERTQSINIGVDLTMFKRRWDFSADYYIKNTDNLLLDMTKAPSVGVTTTRENVGEVENKGFEFHTRVIPIQNKDWQWSIGLTYAYNKNKIKKISNALREQNEKNQQDGGVSPLPVYEEGQSLTALKVVPSAGIDPATGQEVYIKRDGSYTFVYDANDKVIFGDTTPFGTGALSTYLTYRQFSLSASFSYSFGGAAYNQTLATKVEGANPNFNADERVFYDRWRQPGDIAKYKNISDQSTPMQTSRFVQKNNYITLNSLSLAYEVPTAWIKKYGLRRLHLELVANDIFYWSSVKRERGLSYPYDRSVELSSRFSL